MSIIEAASKTSGKKHHGHDDLASELLRAAEAELWKNGIEAFSLRAVARRAGVSHGAPAHHFTDVRGLLTALASIGYERFIEAQNKRQLHAEADPRSQLVACGLGYVDFATENPALFRLMFSSEKPDRTNERFANITICAFNKLVADIQNIVKTDPYADPIAMTDLMASWAIVHGLADLMIAGRTEIPMSFNQMTQAERDSTIADIFLRVVPEIA